MSVLEPRTLPLDVPARRRTAQLGLAAGLAFMVLLAPVVLFAGAGNPPCAPGLATPAGSAGGPAPGGMFAAPLQLQPGHWYRVGATQYGGPADPSSSSWGASGAYLPGRPDSFAELSVLDSNPANRGTFTFQDANALNNLAYGTALRVANAGQQRVLYKRDIGYGQGPGQSILYRLDVWWESAGGLGISKNPVQIELAPASGAGALLGQLPPLSSPSGNAVSSCLTAGSQLHSPLASRRRSFRAASLLRLRTRPPR